MNGRRLSMSLLRVRAVNEARLAYSGWAGRERVRHAELALEQHDADCAARAAAAQTTIWDVITPEALR